MIVSVKKVTAALMFASGLALTACGGAPSSSTGNVAEVENTGPWSLDSTASYINYTTIKAGEIGEPNTFNSMDGKVGEDGAAEVTIVLDSIVTNIDSRDSRMREFVFKTNEHPYAVIRSNIDMASLSSLADGERTAQVIAVNVELAGASNSYDADVFVTRIGRNSVLVDTRVPINVHPKDFGLQEGVDHLQELALLNSIMALVPVNFSLKFTR
jgi:hypothetical protein